MVLPILFIANAKNKIKTKSAKCLILHIHYGRHSANFEHSILPSPQHIYSVVVAKGTDAENKDANLLKYTEKN